MASSPAMTGGFSQLLTRDYHKVFFDEYMRYEDEWSRVFNVESHNEHQYKEGQLAGFGRMSAVNEGQATPMVAPEQGNEKEVTFTTYRMGFQITEEMYDDDLTGHMKKMPQELGKSAAYTKEVLAWDLFNSGFSSDGGITGVDGKTLFADDHPLIGVSDTLDNQGTAATLSRTALQSALNHFHSLKNEMGIPIKATPKLLVIPYQLQWVAEELLMSEYKPGTADNDVNAIKNISGLQYMISHYLTSSTAWFVLAAKEEHDLRWINRKDTWFRSWDDSDTGNAMFSVGFRVKPTFFDWRGTFGNAGA